MDDAVSLVKILDDAVAGLDQCVQLLANSFPPPRWVRVHGFEVFRHHPRQRDDLLLSFMKLTKIASHNNAAMVLIRAGYVYEVYALCRMIDEACEDIRFLQEPDGEDGKPSQHQRRFIEEFYQEEFSGSDLVESHTPRDRVPRKKVRAANARLTGSDGIDPDREIKVGGVLAGTFSGYVHGAYVHLMEAFNGLRFQTRGMSGTPGIQECLGNQVHYVCRSLLAVEGVGIRAYREDVVYRALDLNIALGRLTKCIKPEGIEGMLRIRSRPLVKPT